MPNNQGQKLYLVKGNNNLYHPRLLTNTEAEKKTNIFILNDNKPFELKKILDKANKIFNKLQFKIKKANSKNNEWQNINMSSSSHLKELAELKIKVNGKNFYLKDIFPNPNSSHNGSNKIINSKNFNYSIFNNKEKITETQINQINQINPIFRKNITETQINTIFQKNKKNNIKTQLLSDKKLINMSTNIIKEVTGLLEKKSSLNNNITSLKKSKINQ